MSLRRARTRWLWDYVGRIRLGSKAKTYLQTNKKKGLFDMEKIFRTLLFAVAVAACCGTAAAQDKGKRSAARQQRIEARARSIAQQLAFDDKTTAKFVDTYSRCKNELRALEPQGKGGKGAPMTDAETKEAIESRFERSQKRLDIRKKSYEEYSKFLAPKQIQRVYDIDKGMAKRLGMKAATRKPFGWRLQKPLPVRK